MIDRRKFLIGVAKAGGASAVSFALLNRCVSAQSAELWPADELANLDCGTLPPSDKDLKLLAKLSEAVYDPKIAKSWKMMTVPCFVHVIHSGSNGKVSEERVRRQMRTINQAVSAGRIEIKLMAIRYIDQPDWFEMGRGSRAEEKAKKFLGKNTKTSLNFYIANLKSDGFNGYTYYPWKFKNAPWRDGIAVHHEFLPDGPRPFNLGHTACHEVGHWLGLYHTFQNGCREPGDKVTDTPYQGSESPRNCNLKSDTCASRQGTDPVWNFMDKSSDDCRQLFTPGQFWRIRQVVLPKFKKWLLP